MRTSRRRLFSRIALAALLLLVGLAEVLGWVSIPLFKTAELASYDARVRLSTRDRGNPNVVVIDIDEASIAEIGQWPWPRSKLAGIVDAAFNRYGLKALGLDVVFPEADQRSGVDTLTALADTPLGATPQYMEVVATLLPQWDQDGQLADAIRGKPVALGFVFKDPTAPGASQSLGQLPAPVLTAAQLAPLGLPLHAYQGYTGNLATLQGATAHGGYFDNLQGVDRDGVFRKVPLLQSYGGAAYPSLALAVAQLALGNPPLQLEFDDPSRPSGLGLEALRLGRTRIPVSADTSAYVSYYRQWPGFDYIPAADVLQGRVDANRLRGKVALLGTTAPGLLDLRTTPLAKATPGVEVHASLLAGILDARIAQVPAWNDGLLVLQLVMITVMLFAAIALSGPMLGGAVAAGLALLQGAWALWAYQQSAWIVPLGLPVLYTALAFLVLSFQGYLLESRRVAQVSSQFGEYIPPELVTELADNPQLASTEGEKREMTVLFSDVRGFTTISEGLDSRQLATLMNAFLTPLTADIHHERGTIDKYMGDAIMAFWGAPLPDPQHAHRALFAARAMIATAHKLDHEFKARGWPPLRIGVGLNTGDMTVGNMGSQFRRAYTVMGDAVNLGSRLESLTKAYGVEILISDSTRKAGPANWAYRPLDLVRVKGKKQPIAIFEPLGPESDCGPEVLDSLVKLTAALDVYRAQDWDAATSQFTALQSGPVPHAVYAIYLDRIAYLQTNPPGNDWDGAFTFTHK